MQSRAAVAEEAGVGVGCGLMLHSHHLLPMRYTSPEAFR